MLLSTALLASLSLSAQPQLRLTQQYRNAQEWPWINQYLAFLRIPNESRDTANLKRNVTFITQWMHQLGLQPEVLEGNSPNTTPAILAKVLVPGAKRTLAFYAHYDGQPVDASQWAPGLQPFEPVFLTAPVERGGTIIPVLSGETPLQPEWRISGRGSADDKAGIMTVLNAYETIIRSGLPLKNNLIFFFEGEEEIGSTHIGDIFEKHRHKLKADVWMIADGPRHVSGRKVVQFGVRGDVNLWLTVYGAKRPLHSGNYGNWAPNPARMLVELLAGMKDESGSVSIPGFYDDVIPLTPREQQALKAIPEIEGLLKKELGILVPEGNGIPFPELLHLPTLNINGIQSAQVGAKAANIIPVKAEAVLDLRLVAGNDVKRQVDRVKKYIASKGYHLLDREPTDEDRRVHPKLIRIETGEGYNAQRTPMDLPIAQDILKAVQSTSSEPVVALPSAGGSLPLIVFEEKLGARVITIPVVNYDNNQHAENENVQIRFLWEGIETMIALMMMN